MNVQVSQTDNILKEELSPQGIEYLDNYSLLYGKLCEDGVHFNNGGPKRFARNIKKYVEF